jgi:hypothetical protein
MKNKAESVQLTLSREQYEALVGLLYLGDWVLHSHEVPDPQSTAPEQAVIQSILARAREVGFADLVEERDGEIGPSRVLEDRMSPYINAYDALTMWDELVMALAQRDAERAVGLKALEKMTPVQRAETFMKHEEFWAEEFEQHGLERLVVADPGPRNGA